MSTYWIDPTLSLMDQQELNLAWNQQIMHMFLEMYPEAASESEGEGGPDEEEDWDFGDEPWEEGPQTPPFGAQIPRGRLVPVGGGLAVSIDTDSDDEEWASDASSMTAP